MQVKIIEQDLKKCEALCESLPKATIIHGDAADHDLLIEEGIREADALISLYWYGRGEYHYGIVCKDAGRA